MKISIILTVYNEERHLQQCLETLMIQTYRDYEIIVVDDGSKIPVNELNWPQLRDSRISLHRVNHCGPAIARNYAVKMSKGEIFVFLDGDMFFEPNFIQELVDPVIKNQAKGSYSVQEYVANWDNIWARCWNWENGLSDRLRIQEIENMQRDFRAIEKSEFERVGGFSDIGYTDTWTLSQKLGYLPVKTNAKYYHYNPDRLKEVFLQAKWIGGRVRRYGLIGQIGALFRASLPVSLCLGLYKSIRNRHIAMLPFKLIYDLGISTGILYRVRKK